MRSALPLWIAVACSAAACKSNESTTPASPGDVVLQITALHPRNDDVWLAPRDPNPQQAGDIGYPGDPEPVVIGCDRRLGVDATITNYYLRAPDACAGNVQCGLFVVEIDPGAAGVTGRAAAESLLVDLCPFESAGTLAGEHVLHPRLEQQDGTTFTSPFAMPPVDLTVTFASDSCASTRCQGAASGGESGAGGSSGEMPAAGGAGGNP
jgi:hypothetical protein